MGNSNEPKQVVLLEPAMAKVAENGPFDDQKVLNAQRLPHGQHQLSVQKVTN